MKINTEYDSDGDKRNYHCFTCYLDNDTLLKLVLIDKDACKIIMKDRVNDVTEVYAKINSDDVKALIKTLTTVYTELNKGSGEPPSTGHCK